MQSVFVKTTFSVFLVVLVSLMLSQTARADVTEVHASVDKNPAMVDEGIVLEVTANDSVDSNKFDPSPLLKDFVVGRTSVSSQTQIVNFDMTRTTKWTTHLIPREAGRFQIPAFEIDGVRSQPINLMVLPASSATRGQARDIFIDTKADLSQVYLQQQIHYTVKLYLARDLQRGSLSAPKLQGADIRQIGKDKEYSEIENGQRYRVIERRFAIIPQTSGKFTIEGPLFDGEVVERNSQSFGFFNQTKTITRVGPSIEVEVLPIPAAYPYHWLPSEYVELHEEWQGSSQEYRVGEPITRTVTLTALGVVEEQLPAVESQYPDSVKTYPDQANSATVEKDDTLVAQRTETVAIIPSKAGELLLPEIRIPWFNIVTRQTEFATLPAKTIQIEPAAPGSTNAIPQQPEMNQAPAPDQQAEPMDIHPPVSFQTHDGWWSVSSTVLLVLWLLTLLLWWWQSQKQPKRPVATVKNEAEDQAWQNLMLALKNRDSQQTVQALTHWLNLHFGIKGSLAQCRQRITDTGLNTAIEQLLASRYAPTGADWDANGLKASLITLRKEQKRRKQRPGEGLVSLNIA
ncbi:BatD family protein [Bowmanella yangjiangensis]|uniref:Protein BatD n=1 Tax=Bowmanella yangjiangensis TaxID=2811230 RepID=A0ABS3CPH5_9ALTE|nr:BatD family protein [Bowmanella yangjiangensis]MBN7818989.1 protein BatD [Bowmanella yangjiangensis]